jgi:TRAP transporter TAXI family solute receptor
MRTRLFGPFGARWIRGLSALAAFALTFAGGVSAQEEAASSGAPVGKTIDVGKTGFAVKRPVLASACPHACPWGELGEFVQEAMRPLGYDVVLCRNCNRTEGPRVVGKASLPPQLQPSDLLVGTTERVNAPVDFGITESGFLSWAYNGRYIYEKDGPYRNLRLIAKIEDPYYLLVAVKPESGITDLAQIKEKRLPVRIMASVSPSAQPVLDFYGLSEEALKSWGGFMGDAMLMRNDDVQFDVIISDLGAPTNNPESAYWPRFTQKYDLKFLELPEELLGQLEQRGMVRVTAKWGLLRGIDRPIRTVARSGEAVFARADMPDQAAYDAAKAIDEHQSALKWYARQYSYDPKSVWKNFDVPLHPGAERYYRERGYMK